MNELNRRQLINIKELEILVAIEEADIELFNLQQLHKNYLRHPQMRSKIEHEYTISLNNKYILLNQYRKLDYKRRMDE